MVELPFLETDRQGAWADLGTSLEQSGLVAERGGGRGGRAREDSPGSGGRGDNASWALKSQ